MKIGLFIPCYINAVYPHVGIACYKLLVSLGMDVDYPVGQTCCGQPMANGGFETGSVYLAERFEDLFKKYDYIVGPSASCVAFVKENHPRLLAEAKKGECTAAKHIYDITEFLHDVIKPEKFPSKFPHKVSIHNSCHGVRELGLSSPSELTVPYFNKIRSLLREEVPGRTADYHLILAVDTNYPLQDAFYQGVLNYARQRALYGVGMIFLFAGASVMLLTLISLSLLSGHKRKGAVEIQLLPIDCYRIESKALLLGALCALCMLFATQVAVRILHLMLPTAYWSFSEKLLHAAIIYLFVLLFWFSALRMHKAKILWQNSFLRELFESLVRQSRTVSFVQRMTVYYLLFLLVNLAGAVTASFFLLHGKSLNARLEASFLILLLAIFDLWLYQHLYQKQSESDEIAAAIGLLDSEPDRSEQLLDPERCHGKGARLAATINNINAGLQRALNDSVRSERMKAELITNVSHDIKTPLTSIINYIDLIRRAHPSDPAVQNYVDILERKSQHLKTLTEDLVEASKASTGNVQIDPVKIDFVELVEQTNGEFEERFSESGLTLIPTLPEEPLYIFADGQHLWRVLENLYNNACKYAAKNSRVYAEVSADEAFVSFTLKNISASALNISPEELTERFVRGDRSRTTEGSGLGLSIAKSLTELQGGTLDIQIDGDYFKASVRFRRVTE